MNFLKQNDTVAIWGCGKRGKEFIEKWGDFIHISHCIDNKIKAGETGLFYGFKVYNPEILKDSDIKVIVAIEDWENTTDYLTQAGYKILKDYFPYSYLEDDIALLDMGVFKYLETDTDKQELIRDIAKGRLICATYGMCHMNVYKEVFIRTTKFKEKYLLLDIPPINAYNHKNYNVYHDDSIWQMCDVVLCSVINKMLKLSEIAPSVEDIKSKLKRDCKILTITGSAFKGFFPQQAENRNIAYRSDIEGGITDYFAWADKNINRMVLQKKTVEEIKETILKDDYYDKEMIIKFFHNELSLLEREERLCDVKIADYIRELSVTRVTHYSFTHPIPEVMLEIAYRILCVLGLNENIEYLKEETFLKMNNNEEIIYPSVLKALNLLNEDNMHRKVIPGYRWKNHELTIDEYIENYIKYNFSEEETIKRENEYEKY